MSTEKKKKALYRVTFNKSWDSKAKTGTYISSYAILVFILVYFWIVSFYKLDALLFSVDSPDRIKDSLSSTTCKNVLTRATYMSVTKNVW